MMLNRSNKLTQFLYRKFSNKAKPKVIANEKVIEEISNEEYKPKNHPGRMKPKVVFTPPALVEAIQNVVQDYPIKALLEDSIKLNQHLLKKHPPIEKDELTAKTHQVREKIENKIKHFKVENEKDEKRYKDTVQANLVKILKHTVYNWKPVNYNTYNSLVYLIGRTAPEYSVLYKILSEINLRDPNFMPRSLFDFGSGVGTVTWAVNSVWTKPLFEYFNVDASSDMNDLAQILLQEGKGTKQMTLKGVFYRQFLSANNLTYDLVVAAYSLLELPSRQARLETLLKLWNKTGKYLIIVEQGTNSGFGIVNEVRDFILNLNKKENSARIFSPCPHDLVCPRFVLNDDTPCNFQIFYYSLPVGQKSERKLEKYSYIVIKKGERDTEDPQWPRIVRETLVRSKHTICRMCTKNGHLQEVIFTTSKHGKTLYHCARASKWGDLLPINIDNPNTMENHLLEENKHDETLN